jgi:hypothetical protein
MRPRPQPLMTFERPDGTKVHKWAHRLRLKPYSRLNPDRKTRQTAVECYDCDWSGKYPTYEHARAVADEHLIRTHVTGAQFCNATRCDGCSAIRRKAKR